MRILVLTKRQYMGMDLLDNRFGRFRELPLELARLGNVVAGVALSYRPKNEAIITDADTTGKSTVTWHSINLTRLGRPRLLHYAARTTEIAKAFRPELIWSCSDAYHAVFGTRLARKLGVASFVDLYDNFEYYGATLVPGVLPLFKGAVQMADGVTCVSRSLANYIAHQYRRQKPISILNNAARTDLFFPRDRCDCRRQLGLAEGATIIGTAGALRKSRGVNTLIEAFNLLSQRNSGFYLALAGPRSRFTKIPKGPMVYDLGSLRPDTVPVLFNALDVAVICNRDSTFGRYCFPQKAYEIVACRVPFVAAAVGSIKKLLFDYPQCLYEPDSAQSLAQSIERQLKAKSIVNLPAPSWADAAKQLEAFFRNVLHGGAQTDLTLPAARNAD